MGQEKISAHRTIKFVYNYAILATLQNYIAKG